MKTRTLLAMVLAVFTANFVGADIVERHIDPDYALTLRNGELCRNETSGTLSAGTLVYLSSFDVDQDRFLVEKADANVAGSRAKYIVPQSVANNTNFYCEATYVLTGQNTSGSTVGNPVYLSETAGSITLTAPTSANSIQQIVGRVRVVDASAGIVELNVPGLNQVKIGSNEIQAGGVAPTNIGLTVRASTALAAGDLVYLSSYNATDGVYIAAVADADVSGGQAVCVANGTIAINTTGTCYKSASVTMNTGGSTVGDPVYLTITGTTGNTLSLNPPTGVDDFVQIVGRVQTVAAGGTALIDLMDFVPGVARNEIQADAVNGAKIADDSIDSEHYVDGSIDTAFIADNQVTLAKIVDFTGQGYIIRGGAAGAPEEADFSTQGSIGVGDGTTFTMTDFSGAGHIGVGDGTDYASTDFSGAGYIGVGDGTDYVSTDFSTQGYIGVGDGTTFTSTDFSGAGYIGVGDGTDFAPTDFSGAGYIGVGTGTAYASTDFSGASQIGVGTGSAYSSVALSGLLDISTAGKTTLDARFKQFNFRDPALLILSDMSAVAGVGATNTNQMTYPEGVLFEYLEEAVAGSIVQTVTDDGIDFGMDNVADDGIQIGPPMQTGGESFTGQTDAFYAKMTFTVEDASGTDPVALCLLTPQAYGDIDAVADLANYGGAGEEILCMATGTGAGTDPATIHQVSNTNNGGIQNNAFTTSDYQLSDGTETTWQINIAATGEASFLVDGNAPGGGGAAITLTADEFFVLVVHDSSTDVNDNFYIKQLEWGLQ